MADGIRRYLRAFVLACAFSSLFSYFSGGGWGRGGFVCKFSWFPALQLLRCSFFVVILVLFVALGWSLTGFS